MRSAINSYMLLALFAVVPVACGHRSPTAATSPPPSQTPATAGTPLTASGNATGTPLPLVHSTPETSGKPLDQSTAQPPVAATPYPAATPSATTATPYPAAPFPAAAPAGGLRSGGGSGLQSGGSSLSGSVSGVERAMGDLNARTVGNEIVIDLPADVLFDFDKHNIRPDAAAALDKLLTIINAQPPRAAVRIEGHTDSIADDTYNQRLSERRAASVRTWLIARGVAASRPHARGFGESSPRAPNTNPDGSDNPAGRQQNRRVEVVVSRE